MRASIPSPRVGAAFTLVELLAAIVIIALLASLITPGVESAIENARCLSCLNNLRQIYVAANGAAADNDNKYPAVELDPANPIYGPDDNAKTMLEAFGRYGIGEKNLQCPTDVKLQSQSSFTKFGSSYSWAPVSEDENPSAITVYTPRGAFPGKLSRIRLAQDWTPIHPSASAAKGKRPNTIYADGHVVRAGEYVRVR